MIDPKDVYDSRGEWVELANLGDASLRDRRRWHTVRRTFEQPAALIAHAETTFGRVLVQQVERLTS